LVIGIDYKYGADRINLSDKSAFLVLIFLLHLIDLLLARWEGLEAAR